jgi:hypothetical protein
MWTKWNRHGVLGLCILLIAASAILAIAALQRRATTPRDKCFVRVVSVMVGTNFNYQVGRSKPWIQMMLKALPPFVGSYFDAWLGMGSGSLGLASYQGQTNVVVFTASEQPSGSGGPEALVVFDSDGNTVLAAQGASTIGSDDGKRFRTIKGWLLQAFPRRAKTLGLRFMRSGADHQTWQQMAELHIRNPLFARYPVWVPEPVPAPKIAGDLNVTLTGLQTGICLDDPGRAAQANATQYSRAIFTIQQLGRPDAFWRARSVEIVDATGNRWSPFIPPESLKHNDQRNELVFAGALWPGEAAWKLRVEFARTAGFEDQELWTVRGLRVPQALQTLYLQNTMTNQLTILSLVAFTGGDADQPGNLKWLMEKGDPRISVRAEPVPEGWRLSLVRVVDDQGREAEFRSGNEWGWSNGEEVFGLKLQPDASRVDCTFALHKSRFLEFLARPTFASATRRN